VVAVCYVGDQPRGLSLGFASCRALSLDHSSEQPHDEPMQGSSFRNDLITRSPRATPSLVLPNKLGVLFPYPQHPNLPANRLPWRTSSRNTTDLTKALRRPGQTVLNWSRKTWKAWCTFLPLAGPLISQSSLVPVHRLSSLSSPRPAGPTRSGARRQNLKKSSIRARVHRNCMNQGVSRASGPDAGFPERGPRRQLSPLISHTGIKARATGRRLYPFLI
jgi:hypothetical protein